MFLGSSRKVGESCRQEEASLRDPVWGCGNLNQKPIMASAGDRHVAAGFGQKHGCLAFWQRFAILPVSSCSDTPFIRRRRRECPSPRDDTGVLESPNFREQRKKTEHLFRWSPLVRKRRSFFFDRIAGKRRAIRAVRPPSVRRQGRNGRSLLRRRTRRQASAAGRDRTAPPTGRPCG